MDKTIHNETCVRVFKNYDITCPRCQELANGAEPRKGWRIHRTSEVFKSCTHNNQNPGGYCRTCGNGRDFS